MPGMEETEFYEGPPTVAPAEGEDDWFASAQMGRTDLDSNNDLSGEENGAEIEQP